MSQEQKGPEWAEALVREFEDAVEDTADGPMGDMTWGSKNERRAQKRLDLIQALTVPQSTEEDDAVRDGFAKVALPLAIQAYERGNNWTRPDACRHAYEWAVFMMAERSRRQGSAQ
jgi:hypothetical protein